MIDPPWRIELFGRLRVTRGDHCHTRFRTQKTEILLAYLAYFLRPHPREALMGLLWPDAEPSAARHSLSQALSSLRHVLEPPGVPAGAVLAADRIGVGLDPDAVTIDAVEFDGALRAAGTSGGAGQASWLGRAVELYRGELLAGYYEDWVLQERHELAERYFQALSQWIAHLEGAGDLSRAVEYARRGVRVDPLREEAHRELIRLLAAAGQPAAALRQYRELERLLAEELGEAPTGATRALARELGAGRAFPSPIARPYGAVSGPSSVPIPSPLPLRLTRFFGRESEIAQLLDLLLAEAGAPRLVTLTGPGGSGKTRLAQEVAECVAEAWRGSSDPSARAPVWFVSLTDLTEARFIPDTIREALGLPRSPGVEPLEQVAAALSRQPGLLLLDNVEHLVAEGAPLVRSLLERARPLTCLLTSRRRLGLEGEREFFLLPLPVPDPADSPERLARCESVQLFVDRARAANPEFQVTAANAVAVGALCRGLEGIPLALELAAARARVLTPAQMVAHLEARFEFLVSRRTDAPARHRTLRAAVEWSYRLLPPELRRFFAWLSVFRGGWTEAAANAVCDEPRALDYLEQLREYSLVVAELPAGGETAGAEMRFRMPETLREYATEQMAPEEQLALAQRHAAFYLALAEEIAPELRGSNQAVWPARLEQEHDNLRAALGWLVERGEARMGLRLASALARFWQMRCSAAEGRARLAQLLALPGAEAHTALRATALDVAGSLARSQGDYEAARSLLEESLAIWRELGDQKAVATLLANLANLRMHYQCDYEAMRALLDESLSIRRELGDKAGIADSLSKLGEIARDEGNHPAARSLHEESLALFRELGDRSSIAYALHAFGYLLLQQHDYGAAQPLLAESLAICRQLGDRSRTAALLNQLGHLCTCQGAYGEAQAHLQESLAIERELGHKAGILISLHERAYLALCQQDYAAARADYEESLALKRELGLTLGIGASLHGLGEVARHQGDYDAARRHYADALATWRVAAFRRGIAGCLEGFAKVATAKQFAEPAVRWLAAAANLRQAAGTPLPPNEQQECDRHLAALRATLGDRTYSAAWASGSLLAWEEAAAEALAGTPPRPAVQQSRDHAPIDLTDAEWELLRPLLPPLSPRGRRPTDDRRTLNGILYVLRTRCRWQDLPRRYGSSTTCWRRYARWQADGTWERLRSAFLDLLPKRP